MPAQQLRRVCFTLNNPTEEEKETIRNLKDNIRYMIVGEEVGEQGTPHLQGYIGFEKRKTFNSIKELIGQRAHIESAKGNDEQNRKYCTKEGQVLVETGTMQQVKSIDLQVKEAVKRKADGANPEEMIEEYGGIYIRYKKAIDEQCKEMAQFNVSQQLKEEMGAAILKKWQELCVKEVEQQNDRSVAWYWEPTGNVGKTWLSKWLVVMKNAVRFENGKSADIKYGYNGEHIVCFDLTRSQSDHINYEVIESVKNGIMYNTKYESKMKCYKPPKVVIFANTPPDMSKMSADRWNITQIDPTDDTWLDNILDALIE